MKLDKHSSVPLYFQLKEFILKKIDSNEYPRGEKIPSELEFCAELDLSRPTVRQAVAELVTEGKLLIIKGKGTYVSAISDSLEFSGFNCATFSFFNAKEVNSAEIIDVGLVDNVTKEIEEAFSDRSLLQDGVIYIYKILSNNSSGYAYIESYIPRTLFPNLIEDIAAKKNMVDITVNKYAYLPVRGTCKISVIPADSNSSRALDIPRGAPVLSAKSVLISKSGVPCEVLRVSMRSDVCSLSL